MKFHTLTVAIFLAGLFGCSSTPSENLVAQQAIVEQQRAEQDEDLKVKRQEKMEEHVAMIPDWILDVPKANAIGFYGTGMAESMKYASALKKGRLQAEFDLAKQYKQELSGSERSFEKESGDELVEQTTFLIDKLVADVSVVGYDIVKQEIKVIDGKYHAFVLLKLPYDEFNKVLIQRKKETVDDTAKAAFDELMERVQAKRDREAALDKKAVGNAEGEVEKTESNEADLNQTKAPVPANSQEVTLKLKKS